MYKAAIFDMDGTILDTLSDLCNAINYSFEKAGHKHDFTIDETKTLFGSGVDVAIKRGLAMEMGFTEDDLLSIGTDHECSKIKTDSSELSKIKAIYKPYYEENCAIKTGPFPGINNVVENLRKAGIKTAVVSNKPNEAVLKLCETHFKNLFDVSIGEMEGVARKPAKDMTLKAIESLNVSESETVYIVDSEIDILTAKNAGLNCICVDWGFRSSDFLIRNNATVIVSDAMELFNEITK